MSAIVLVAYPAAGLQGRSRGWPHTLPPSRRGVKIAEAMLTPLRGTFAVELLLGHSSMKKHGEALCCLGARAAGTLERRSSLGGNIRREVAELTLDSVFTCTRNQVFLSHSRIALLSNGSPLARRMSRGWSRRC